MSLIALMCFANLAVAPAPMLILEKVRTVDDPRTFDLRDPVKGDRGVPRSCALAAATTVTLVSGINATLEVERGGNKKSIVVENVRGLGRSTLACGISDNFYFANPRHGQVFAYSANRLFGGQDPIVWTRKVAPFRGLDETNGVMTDASVATVVQVRGSWVLVEWLFRKDGTTGFWHEIFASDTGTEVEKLGPSDLLVKTNETDPWWIVFQGGGNETANYVPQNIYRLKYVVAADGGLPAAAAIAALSKQSQPSQPSTMAKLSPNPVVNHMIALLSPTRTTPNATVEFCPTVPGQRARYWLGSAYDSDFADMARNALLAFWAERQRASGISSPIDAWFKEEIAPKEPMKSLLDHFNPQDDAWIVQYQKALFDLGGPTLESILTKYGKSTGAFARTPSATSTP